MDEFTGWWETAKLPEKDGTPGCDHDIHLLFLPADAEGDWGTHWRRLTKNELALLVLVHGITQEELDKGTVVRGSVY